MKSIENFEYIELPDCGKENATTLAEYEGELVGECKFENYSLLYYWADVDPYHKFNRWMLIKTTHEQIQRMLVKEISVHELFESADEYYIVDKDLYRTIDSRIVDLEFMEDYLPSKTHMWSDDL